MEIKQLLRKNIAHMKAYSSARDEYKDFEQSRIFLDANENPYNTGVNRYPDPQQISVKKKLAELKGIAERQILLGNGSDEVLDLVFRAFCEPNIDNIITLPPTYGMYDVLANLNAIENREVVLTNQFQPNVEGILSQIDANTKIIFICSPNNPTGNTFSEKSIEIVLKGFNGLVVVDEAYIDFSDKESWLKKIEEYPNLIIAQTLSKAYGLAGIRLGVLYASEEIITILNKIKPPYNVNVLTQSKALEQLNNNEQVITQVARIKRQREVILKQLLEVNFVNNVVSSDANFLLVKVDDADRRYNQLLNKGIVVRNRSTQPLCDNCIRITIGTEEENTQLINALKSIQND
ncbi:histidinol-phosphate transaminase [Flavobacterium sp. GCM10027622]|uniref:histidinol-phosphate transaminase n=1 Tax=unclassified Flavobacterium TaxID=196869 RepID=UPI00362284D1